jgi:hypothetical protein
VSTRYKAWEACAILASWSPSAYSEPIACIDDQIRSRIKDAVSTGSKPTRIETLDAFASPRLHDCLAAQLNVCSGWSCRTLSTV